jgi:hypothetical protein
VEHQGGRDAKAFAKTLEEAQKVAKTYDALRKKADGGDAGARARLLAFDLKEGGTSLADAKAKVEALGKLSGQAAAEVKGALATIEYKDEVAKVGDQPNREVTLGAAFAAMLKEGRVPDDTRAPLFYRCILVHAARTRAAALFERVFPAFERQAKALYGNGSPRFRNEKDWAESLRKDMHAGKG